MEMGDYYINLHTSPTPKAFVFSQWTEKGPNYTRQELSKLQAYWAVNCCTSKAERESMRFYDRHEDHEAILQARLKPCEYKLPAVVKKTPMREAAELRRNLGDRDSCFEGQAQHPSTWTLDDIDTDTQEARETRYWQQRYVLSSPDLFCDEVFYDDNNNTPPPPYKRTPPGKQRYIFGNNSSDEDISTPPSPVVIPCAQRSPLIVWGKDVHTGDAEDPIELSDAEEEQPVAKKAKTTSSVDEGVVLKLDEVEETMEMEIMVLKHEEMIKRRKLTRAEHCAVETMTKLCEAEGYSMLTHADRLKKCKQRLYTRKRDYHKAVEACVKWEEEMERRKEARRLAKEAYAACVEEERAIRLEKEVAEIVIPDSEEEAEEREEMFREER